MAGAVKPKPEPEPAAEPAAEPEPEPDYAAPDTKREEEPEEPEMGERRERTVRTLMTLQLVRQGGMALRMATDMEIWMRAYAGDPAGQANAQAIVGSLSSAVAFVSTPIVGGLSDAYGRRSMMLMGQLTSTVISALMTWRPTVPVLVVRHVFMYLTASPYETGEKMMIADMFRDDPGAYGQSNARCQMLGQVMMIAGPVLGARLASSSLRLPWAVNTVTCIVGALMVQLLLDETLPPCKRVPFRWSHSSPLSFMELFRRGAKMRAYVLVHVWQSLTRTPQFGPFGYDDMHLQTLFNWSLEQRGFYNSFQSLCSVPGSWVAGKLLQTFEPDRVLYIGQVLASLSEALKGLSTKPWHFYASRPLYGLSGYTGVLMTSMSYTATAVGAECGVPEGQLQSSLATLQTICRVVSPMLWSPIYAFGLRSGRPGLFYFVSAGAGVLQLFLLRVLACTAAPPKSRRK